MKGRKPVHLNKKMHKTLKKLAAEKETTIEALVESLINKGIQGGEKCTEN